ncbi:MAG: hypothetical protein FD181_1797 [Prolixibacteraceae bacterium]|nr:MAG: hypothetical protein FD181_1797 [Prolixibacteraceae bacterium]
MCIFILGLLIMSIMFRADNQQETNPLGRDIPILRWIEITK